MTTKLKLLAQAEALTERTLTLYRDDSTTQVVFERVKHFFWTAGNTVLTIAQYSEDRETHHYIHWPRERICWFRDTPSKRSNP